MRGNINKGGIIKAISIKQPYASLIAEGKKTIETRTWQTKYRGNILICSSKARDERAMMEFRHPQVIKFLDLKYDLENAPTGMALCIAELYDIKPMTKEDVKKACCYIYDGAYSWFLRGIRKIEPFEVKGMLNLFEVNDDLIQIRRRDAQ